MIEKVTGLVSSETPQADATKLKKSAREFEALLIAQMLKSARESGGSWFGGGEDEAASAATGMAEEHLAQTLSAQGGLGLASMVVKGLEQDQELRDSKTK
jgi:Rod binding domain-containing protein